MSQENVEAVMRAIELYNEHGVGAVAASGFWRRDIVWHDPVELPDARTYHGIEEAKAAFQGYVDLAGHMKVDVAECIDAGEEIFIGWQLHGRGVGSGAPIEGWMYQVWTVKQGKLVRFRQFLDRGNALEAAGLSE
jgi:ketosteroid isomerase-like protein